MKRFWTADETTRLRQLAASGASMTEAASALNRSLGSVQSYAPIANISFRHNGSPTVARCRRQCTGKYPCMLRADVEQTLCVCRNPNCVCHSEARYAEAKRERMAR